MLFSYGNLVTLVVVLLILVIYRALDRNNRSLEKLKRFSDKITENMSALVEQKTAEVRDLGLELQASLKTGKEILARARGVEELLQNRNADIEVIEKRFTDYDKALAELTAMSARVDKNLLRIRDESEFVDGLGKRIEESAARLDTMEQRLPEIEEELSARAAQAVAVVQDKMIGVVDSRVASLASALQSSEAKVKDYSAYIARLESREEQAGKERLAAYARALDTFDVGLKGKISEAVRRSETLEDEVFARLSARIQADEAAVAKSLETIEARLSDYHGDIEYRVRSMEESSRDVDSLRASLTETVERVAAGVRGEMKTLGAELVAGWTSEIAAASAARDQLRSGMTEIESELSVLKTRAYQDTEKNLSVFEDEFFTDLRARSAAMQEKLAAWQAGIEQRAGEFETVVRSQVDAAEASLQTLRESLRGDVEKVKRDASAAYQKDLAAVRDSLETGSRRMNREIEAGLAALTAGLEAGRRELGEQLEAARAEVTAWEGKAKQQLTETEGALSERVSALSAVAASTLGDARDSFTAKNDELRQSTEAAIALVRAQVDGVQAETQKRMREMQAELELKMKEHRQVVADAREKAEALQEKLLGRVEESLDAGRVELAQQVEASRIEVAAWQEKARERLAEAEGSVSASETALAERVAALSAEAISSISAVRDSFSAQKEELKQAAEAAAGAARAQIEGFQAETQKRARDVQAEMDGRMKELRQALADAREKAEGLQGKLIGKVEESLEAGRRELIQRLDASRLEVTEWEENARRQLAGTESSIAATENALAERVAALSAEANSSIGAVRDTFSAQKDELKESADAAVSAVRSQIETFQAEAQRRAREMQVEIDGKFKELRQVLTESRERAGGLQEKLYAKVEESLAEARQELEQRLDASRTDVAAWEGKAAQQLSETEAALAENVAALSAEATSSIGAVRDSFSAQKDELKQSADAAVGAVRSQIETFQAEAQRRARDMQVEIDGKMKDLRQVLADARDKAEGLQQKLYGRVEESLADAHRELEQHLVASRSEVTAWEGKASEQLAATETALAQRVAALSVEASSSIAGVRDTFSAQRDELVAAADEERQVLRQELAAMAEKALSHREELKQANETALQAVRAQIDAFQGETQKRVRDLQAEVDGKLKEQRQVVGDAREKAEALQERLLGKVEESHRLLSTSIGEIDKRVKTFLSQTRLFERADSLKGALEGSIDDMKKEIAALNAERAEIAEIEVQITRTRKVAEEVSSKLTRFLTEKRKIEDMDGDFKKIITLSRDVDLKLDTLSANSDALQQIQAKVRQFEEMGKAVEGGFERLEKKKEIITVTAESVDRGFQRLESIEKALLDADREADALSSKVAALKDGYESLAGNKKDADSAMEIVGKLGSIIAELEEKMEKAQNAREWMARTETRFEEIGRQAQEQVRLMESIVKAETRKDKADRGAPPLDKRETVVKLSHQGWSVVEISRVTQLSRGEVELDLELAPKV